MTEITGTARTRGVAVEVFPGGALSALTLSLAALALGPRELATSIVDTVAAATAAANQRTTHALGVALSVLGLETTSPMVERAESTTPETWMV
jgi:hypothetical protein